MQQFCQTSAACQELFSKFYQLKLLNNVAQIFCVFLYFLKFNKNYYLISQNPYITTFDNSHLVTYSFKLLLLVCGFDKLLV